MGQSTTSAEIPSLETRVLAVASHVVSGNVGNKVAVFTMQSLGCDVAALNTVQFSNHTGYKQWTGTRVSAQEIFDLYDGLRQSHLDRFDMMLSGYIPGAAAVEAVGRIAKDLKQKAELSPGSFFWVLDPVMGDNGELYVAQDVVPAYMNLVHDADLILPNQFEAELLSERKIEDMPSLAAAVQALHERYRVPHVVITSVSLGGDGGTLSVVGSTMTAGGRARPFKIAFPAIDAYFSGTGDMFAALMVVRMHEAAAAAPGNLLRRRAWVSDDDVEAPDLPLARAAEKVLASMHEVLEKTAAAMVEEIQAERDGPVHGTKEEQEKRLGLLQNRAAELRLARNVDSLRAPRIQFRATQL